MYSGHKRLYISFTIYLFMAVAYVIENSKTNRTVNREYYALEYQTENLYIDF